MRVDNKIQILDFLWQYGAEGRGSWVIRNNITLVNTLVLLEPTQIFNLPNIANLTTPAPVELTPLLEIFIPDLALATSLTPGHLSHTRLG